MLLVPTLAWCWSMLKTPHPQCVCQFWERLWGWNLSESMVRCFSVAFPAVSATAARAWLLLMATWKSNLRILMLNKIVFKWKCLRNHGEPPVSTSLLLYLKVSEWEYFSPVQVIIQEQEFRIFAQHRKGDFFYFSLWCATLQSQAYFIFFYICKKRLGTVDYFLLRRMLFCVSH